MLQPTGTAGLLPARDPIEECAAVRSQHTTDARQASSGTRGRFRYNHSIQEPISLPPSEVRLLGTKEIFEKRYKTFLN